MKKSRRKKINGKWKHLPSGVRYEKRSIGCRYLAVWYEKGKRRVKYFDDSDEGFKKATDYINMIKEYKRLYGERFSMIKQDEMEAIDEWRKYRDICEENGSEFKKMSEIMGEAVSVLKSSSSITMAEAVEMYRKDKLLKYNGVVTQSMQSESSNLNRISNVLGDRRICTLTQQELTNFLHEQRHSRTGKKIGQETKRQLLAKLKTIYKMLVDREYQIKNVAKNIHLNKPKKVDPEILSLEDVCKIFEYLRDTPEEHKFIPGLVVGFFCGARLSERSLLTYADILRGDRDEIYISRELAKNNFPRYVYTNVHFKAWMEFARDHGVKMDADDSLLPGEKESQRKSAHCRLLKRLAGVIGKKIPKNAMRHTAASNMSEYENVSSAANQLGHRETTLKVNYRKPINREDSTAYFNISPTCCDAEVLRAQAREQMSKYPIPISGGDQY